MIDSKEQKLAMLAMKWRGTKSPQVIEEYHGELNSLRRMGWQGWLDMDSGLPDEHMPGWYLHGEHTK